MQMLTYKITQGAHKRRWISEVQNFALLLPPPLSEQKSIAQILSDMDAEIEKLKY